MTGLVFAFTLFNAISSIYLYRNLSKEQLLWHKNSKVKTAAEEVKRRVEAQHQQTLKRALNNKHTSKPKPLIEDYSRFLKIGHQDKVEGLEEGEHVVVRSRVLIKEGRAVRDASIKVTNACDIFTPNTVVLGFGEPNVWMGVIGERKVHTYAAKSLWRAPTSIEESDGKVQSGVFIVPTSLNQATIEQIIAASQASAEAKTRTISCAKSNSSILSKCGFTIRGGKSIEHHLPHHLLKDILDNGLELDGKEVKFFCFISSPLSLQAFYNSIITAEQTTFIRHMNRCMPISPEEKQERAKQIKRVETENAKLLLSTTPETKELKLHVYVSRTSSWFGLYFQRWFGAHRIYRIALNPKVVDAILSEKLVAFEHVEASFMKSLKQNWIFNTHVVAWIRSWMALRFDNLGWLSEEDAVAHLLPTETGEVKRYNFVITGDSVYFCLLNVKNEWVDWVLSKHTVVSGYSDDVRFAGEMFTKDGKTIHINLNSGTYRPTEQQLDNAVELARKLFSRLQVVADL
jgi:hypothetical protein